MNEMSISKTGDQAARFIEKTIRDFVRTSPLNLIPGTTDQPMFDRPLVGYASGDDALFTLYKTVIGQNHLTPREALALSVNKEPKDLRNTISLISWILPITAKTRLSNRPETIYPSLHWVYTRWHGEQFNDALHGHVVKALHEKGYLATAPALQPFFQRMHDEKGAYSNFSMRHMAFAAGHGTFSLSDGFITEKGMAMRCGAVVTDLILPVSARTATSPYSNCLAFEGLKCTACIKRCPAGAISEKGHDKIKCEAYMTSQFAGMRKELKVGITGCGLCQTKIPCEFKNPTKRIK
jgi:epoxyqueuosine reductase